MESDRESSQSWIRMHPYDIHIKIEYEYEYPYLHFKRIRARCGQPPGEDPMHSS